MTCAAIIFKLAFLTTTTSHPIYLHKISKTICYYANKRNLDPYMILAIAKHESDFKFWKVSRTNDFGLMQVHSKSKIGSTMLRGRKCNLLKIKCNIRWGTYIMFIWKKNHKGKYHWIRRYNWYGSHGKYYLKILWITKAYKLGTRKALRWINENKFPSNLKKCISQKGLCL